MPGHHYMQARFSSSFWFSSPFHHTRFYSEHQSLLWAVHRNAAGSRVSLFIAIESLSSLNLLLLNCYSWKSRVPGWLNICAEQK